MQNISKLKNIADVITGFTFREAIREVPKSLQYVLQARNIKSGLVIDENNLVETTHDTSHTRAFVKDGDVAIGTRGTFRAAVVRSSKIIIASSSVYLLRLNGEGSILPEFLSIYLNSPFGQKDISQIITGAAIKLILRKDLENIEIPVPPIPQQEKLVALYENIKQQENLFKKRSELHKNVINAAFQRLERN